MKKTLAIMLALIMVLALVPTVAFAEGSAIYVSSSGNDTSGNGTQGSPYATLAKAVDEAPSGATIYVMSKLTMTKSARFWDKHLTITSGEGGPYTITRGEIVPVSDPARGSYNPAMIEVQTLHSSASLTLTNIILDDGGNHAGTVFAQAISGEEPGDNTIYVQDAIVASNATKDCTITLGEGAVLRNFGGMSAVRVTDQAKLVMESGSKIEDTLSITRSKGDEGSVGPAGAVWVQGAIFEMKDGAVISNINGRAVYVDGGNVTVGGTISNITGNANMWQETNGTALHLRNNATGTLTATGLIENVTGGGTIVNLSGSTYTMDTGSVMSGNLGKNIAAYGGANTIDMNGEITGICIGKGSGKNDDYQAINLQAASDAEDIIYCKIGATGNIHDNKVWYGSIYVQGNNIELHHYGKINNNSSSDKSGGIVLANNYTGAKVFMYDGAEVIGNKSNNDGAGVMVSCGTFTMNGGKISENIAMERAGGVYVRRGGQFIMNGGEISNNHAKKYGGGVSFVASDYGEPVIYVPYVALNGGTITGNTMGDSDSKVSNDLGIASADYSHINRYLYISDDVTIGNKAVYFETGSKTVTPAPGSFDIKLGNASTATVTALTDASTGKGWSDPIATFWTQRDGAASLTVGGLKQLENNLPVYVLTQKTGADGKPAPDALVHTYAATVDADGNVNFTLPSGDMNDNGCAVAIVQPTTDYGTLTISGPDKLQQNTTDEGYPVTYTVTYTMSDSMKNIIEGGTPTYSLTINKDTRLTGTPGTFDGTSIAVAYTLPKDGFTAGESLFASAELAITVGNARYTVPSNVAETKMIGSGSTGGDSTGGDSTGGDSTGGGHYHPDPTPVPVIVIPPKTGDMTIWQSILHFLGIK